MLIYTIHSELKEKEIFTFPNLVKLIWSEILPNAITIKQQKSNSELHKQFLHIIFVFPCANSLLPMNDSHKDY